MHLPDIAELDRKRKENRDIFEKLVPQSLYSEYLDARQELKLLASKKVVVSYFKASEELEVIILL